MTPTRAIGALLAATTSGRTGSSRALIAGGGTGGHVFPGLAVADQLRQRGWEVVWSGAAGGLEARLAEGRGLPFFPLSARPLVGRGAAARVLALLLLARSAVAAWRLVRRLEVDVVLGTGGYLSAPAVIGAFLARRPVVLLEPNAEAGVANRMLSRLAALAAVAHPTTGERLRCPSRLTGVPVRQAFFEQPDVAELEAPVGLLVLGGSQGALRLNQELPGQIVQAFGERAGVVIHQCGARHLEATLASYLELLPYARRTAGALEQGSLRVEVVEFLDDVASAMGASQVVISRAGAITLAELCAVGRASILVPLPLAGGHQRTNAQALVDAGAAELCDQDRLGELAERLQALIEDRGRCLAMGQRARSLAHPGAAAVIASQLEAAIGVEEAVR